MDAPAAFTAPIRQAQNAAADAAEFVTMHCPKK
jgi:hypothetical protein